MCRASLHYEAHLPNTHDIVPRVDDSGSLALGLAENHINKILEERARVSGRRSAESDWVGAWVGVKIP